MACRSVPAFAVTRYPMASEPTKVVPTVKFEDDNVTQAGTSSNCPQQEDGMTERANVPEALPAGIETEAGEM